MPCSINPSSFATICRPAAVVMNFTGAVFTKLALGVRSQDFPVPTPWNVAATAIRIWTTGTSMSEGMDLDPPSLARPDDGVASTGNNVFALRVTKITQDTSVSSRIPLPYPCANPPNSPLLLNLIRQPPSPNHHHHQRHYHQRIQRQSDTQ